MSIIWNFENNPIGNVIGNSKRIEQLNKKQKSLFKKYFSTMKKRNKLSDDEVEEYDKLDEIIEKTQIELSRLSAELEELEEMEKKIKL